MKVTTFVFAAVVLVLAISPSRGWLHAKLDKLQSAKQATRALACKDKTWHLNGHHCYRVFKNGKSFQNAEIACNDEGGHLASITSNSELTYLTAMIRKTTRSKRWLGHRHLRRHKKHWRNKHKKQAKPKSHVVYKAWIGFLLYESTRPSKVVWTDRSRSKYIPHRYGFYGRQLAKGLSQWTQRLMGQKPTTTKSRIETGTLSRTTGRIGPAGSTSKLPYICKAEASACPKGWRQWRKRCYGLFLKPALSFGDAEQFCVKEHGHLASLHSDAQYEMLMRMIKTKSTHQAWIGVLINHKKHSWAWTDKSKARYLPRSSKVDAKPAGADVARLIYHKGKAVGLHDTIRSKKYGFICQIDEDKHNHGKHRVTTVAPTTTTTVSFT